MQRRSIIVWSLFSALLGVSMIAPVRGQEVDPLLERFDRMVRRNLDQPYVVDSGRLDAAMGLFADLPLGERIASWANWFRELGRSEYVFGLDPDGYVAQGRLCQDFATDCILFLYRVTELARSTTAEEAVQFAFGTRFYGASVERAVSADGRVDYRDPAHLEYSEDMIASGIWGQDVTATLGAKLRKSGDINYIATADIPYRELRTGDIVWFVGEAKTPPEGVDDGRETRLHHVGFVDARQGSVDLIHAAMKPLPGIYDHAGVARVALRTYLERVDRFDGILVTRLQEF